jgi:hypothetical protein
MDDRDLIAAILTGAMLPTQSQRTAHQAARLRVPKAMSYSARSACDRPLSIRPGGLGVDPFAGLPGHDAPKQ